MNQHLNYLEKLDTDTALEVISDIYDDSFAITEEQTSQMNGSQSNETNDKDNSRMKVIIVIVALVGICFIVGTIIFIVSKRKNKEIKNRTNILIFY
jgi:hypothetical protein